MGQFPNITTLHNKESSKGSKVMCDVVDGHQPVDGDDNCELKWAAVWGDVQKLSDLRQQEGYDVNAVDENGWTALMFAAFKGKTEFARRLLEDDKIIIKKRGYDSGLTALDIAR